MFYRLTNSGRGGKHCAVSGGFVPAIPIINNEENKVITIIRSLTKTLTKRWLFAVCGLMLSGVASAGVYQNYGTHYAWVNDFGGGVFGSSFGSGSTANMTFWWNYPDTYNLYGYPAIVRGWHYGWNPTGDTLFPKKISTITSAPCYFAYASGGTNMAGDFAYDIFLRSDSAKSSPQTEVMIWAGHNSWPIGSKTGSSVLTVNGVTYDLWEGYNTSAGYYVFSFVPTGTVGISTALPTSGSLNIDLKTFFNWLNSNRNGSYYNNSYYLDVIEAGLEVTRGNGWSWIQGYFSAS